MAHRPNHVLPYAESRDGILAGEDRPVVAVAFSCPDFIERLLQPPIPEWKRFVSGQLNIEAISEILLPRGVLFHCDAAQAPCAMDIGNLASLADLISLSGHKMYGPKGVGALFVRRDLQGLIEPLFYGGGQQAGLRSGTVPTPLCVGMAAAVDILSSPEGLLERTRVAEQRDLFVRLLLRVNHSVAVNGPATGRRHPGNANLRFDGLVAEDILGSLQPNLAASTGAACASGIPEPSHVLSALGLSMQEAESSIRFSFGRFTTQAELEEAVHLLTESIHVPTEG